MLIIAHFWGKSTWALSLSVALDILPAHPATWPRSHRRTSDLVADIIPWTLKKSIVRQLHSKKGTSFKRCPLLFYSGAYTARNGQYGTENHVTIENTDTVEMSLNSRLISAICSHCEFWIVGDSRRFMLYWCSLGAIKNFWKILKNRVRNGASKSFRR